MMRGCTYLGIALLTLTAACREHESSTKDKELDVQLAQAKARQAEAEAEKAAIEARTHQTGAGGNPTQTPSPSHVVAMYRRSEEDIAQLDVKKYAYEAFGEWAQAHPDKACPDRLEELAQYMDTKSISDPWGHPYRMFCGPNLPAGAKGGLAVASDGPDGREASDDDIRSW